MTPIRCQTIVVAVVLLTLIGGVVAADAGGPYTFLYGMDLSAADQFLRDSTDLGLNTVYLDLDKDDLNDLAAVRRVIRHADGWGFRVIVGLPTTTFTRKRLSPYSSDYRSAVSDTIGSTVSVVSREPGVTAWATGHYLEKHIRYSDEDFRQFLQERYGAIAALNRAWESSYERWSFINQDAALRRDEGDAFGIGRAAVDVADYRQTAYRGLLELWATEIRKHDPDRPLMTGLISLYRSIPSVPDSYDTIAVTMPPEIMTPGGTPDTATHNVHGVDMARRGGKFEVVTTLRLPTANIDRVRDWVREADLHGASGIGLENWERLSENRHIMRTLKPALTEQWHETSLQSHPQPSVAIIHSPYAEGYTVLDVPVYGYLKSFASGQPTTPIEDLRLGTCFGTIDVLAPDDLDDAQLPRYSLLIAPSAVGLNRQQCIVLSQYVRNGGALIADIGAGMGLSGSFLSIPSELQEVLGVEKLMDPDVRAGNLRVSARVPDFPDLQMGMESQGTFEIQVGRSRDTVTTRAGRFAVSSPSAFASTSGGARALAVMEARPAEENEDVRLPPQLQEQGIELRTKPGLFCGLLYNRYGGGVSVFATHHLYQHWPLSDPMNTGLHYDLLARRAPCELVETPFLPDNVEMTWVGDGVRLLNPGARPQSCAMALYGMQDRLLDGALNRTLADVREGRGQQRAVVSLPGERISYFRLTGIQVQPYRATANTLIQQLDETGIRLQMGGPGSQVRPGRGGRPELTRPDEPVTVRITITDSQRYPVSDGSVHTVTIQRRRGRSDNFPVTATADGLSFRAEIDRNIIEITPAE
ncbi:MAG: beta-galactosidase [Armatimonadota bacterium]